MSWQESTLGAECELYQPQTLAKNELDNCGLYKVYGANGVIGTHSKFNHEDSQLLITCRGATCGTINVSEPKSWINGNAMVVNPRKNNLDLNFLKHYLSSLNIDVAITGAAQPQITRQSLSPIKIKFPPLAEQKRIAAILDKAAEIKAKREQAIVKLDELAQSTFIEMFGNDKWRKIAIAEVTERVQNCSPQNKFDREFTYFDIGAVDNVSKRIVNPQLLNKDDAPSRARQLIERDDVLVSTVRPNLNAVAKVDGEYLNAVASTGFCVLRSKQALVLPEYIFAIVKSKNFVNEMVRLATGASYPAVTDKIISQYLIPLPPIEIQRSFAGKVEALRAYAAKSISYDEKLIGLTASLKHRAFTTGFNA